MDTKDLCLYGAGAYMVVIIISMIGMFFLKGDALMYLMAGLGVIMLVIALGVFYVYRKNLKGASSDKGDSKKDDGWN